MERMNLQLADIAEPFESGEQYEYVTPSSPKLRKELREEVTEKRTLRGKVELASFEEEAKVLVPAETMYAVPSRKRKEKRPAQMLPEVASMTMFEEYSFGVTEQSGDEPYAKNVSSSHISTRDKSPKAPPPPAAPVFGGPPRPQGVLLGWAVPPPTRGAPPGFDGVPPPPRGPPPPHGVLDGALPPPPPRAPPPPKGPPPPQSIAPGASPPSRSTAVLPPQRSQGDSPPPRGAPMPRQSRSSAFTSSSSSGPKICQRTTLATNETGGEGRLGASLGRTRATGRVSTGGRGGGGAHRGALLGAIRSSAALKKVEKETEKETLDQDLAGLLTRSLTARRSVGALMKGGGGGGDDDDDDDLWGSEDDEEAKEEEEEEGENLLGESLFDDSFESSGSTLSDAELCLEMLAEDFDVYPFVDPQVEQPWTFSKHTLSELQDIFAAQQEDGSWAMESLGLIGLNPSSLEQYLLSVGAKSLGSSVCNILFKLLSTLLVLKSLSTQTDHSFPVRFSPKVALASGNVVTPTEFKRNIVEAVGFVVTADQKYPSLYSRLELGSSWEQVLNTPSKLLLF